MGGEGAGSTTMKPFTAFNTFINVLMASGPILLPMQVAGAGFGFSLLCLIACCIISMIACEFIIESLSVCNYFNRQNYGHAAAINSDTSVSNSELLADQGAPIPAFTIKDQFEYGSMGMEFFGKKGEVFNVIVIVVYLYGAVVSKGIMVGNSLSSVFSGYFLVDNYTFWVAIFFTISGLLSFKDVASISLVQTIVAFVRYLTILSMLIGASVIMLKYQVMEPIPWFNSAKLPQLISTAIFAYLMHHSSPGMLRPVRPQSYIRTIILSSFSFGLLVFLLIPLTAIWAFPGLSQYCFYNILFDQQYVRWAYYIISFYMFLNIAALPVLTITIRKNLMKLVAPHLMPKNTLAITPATAGFTMLIIIPCGILSIILKDQIEIVIGFTGGLCGTLILLVIPSLMVWKARRRCKRIKEENPFKSWFMSQAWVYLLLGLGVLFLPYNLFRQISNLTHPGSHCQNHFNATITHY